MHPDPLISIIIPVDGTEAYFCKCIESITHQTLSEIEIIVVNDHSTGNIDVLIQQYLTDPRVVYIGPEKKSGLGGARNAGLRVARGKYIGFCDSDDWFDLSFCEIMKAALEDTGAVIASCDLYREYESRPNGIFKCKYNSRHLLNGRTAFGIFTFQYQLEINIVGQVTNKVYRRDFLESNALQFIEGVFYEDLDFNFRAMLHADKFVCVPGVRYHHLKREHSIVQSVSKKHIDDFFHVFSVLKAYLTDAGLYEDTMFNFYAFAERFYHLIVRQIFEFSQLESEKKALLAYTFGLLGSVFKLDEFIQYSSAEKLRNHIQPYISDTAIK
ncbi:glycosyltransferase involved in cell wall biosynthesis [Mucilaginibacter oryzae]|uniref:Glycosyltransferase involved in cell wall biosynthesis n=1 Tax=Mucilaginibacter oryzae TaxID=468058 RepID=A0A316GV28_9SPHI|nr:glycosyltransferase family 2 protein [Mucilaginibacter oryzae]PWK68314.1 glycosyltransferase involved in cell wall biosynthesis [Mucilaginibacter oryzae]